MDTIKKPLLKLIVFLNIFNKSCDEADKILSDEQKEEFEIMQGSEDFAPWRELRGVCYEIVNRYQPLALRHKQFGAVAQTFNLHYGKCISMIKDDLGFFHLTFLFNLLQGCDLAGIKSEDKVIQALKVFDFKRMYPVIQKYRLVNNFEIIKASQYFKRNYWENLK